MTLQQKLDKHYQKLVNQNKREEKKQERKIKNEKNRILFRYRIKKLLFGIK